MRRSPAQATSFSTAWACPPISRRSAPGIETDFKVRAVHSPADMTKPAEIAEMVALGEKTFGSVDILVNNAGIQFVSPIEEFPPEKWEAIIAINLSSAFTASAAVPGEAAGAASSTPPPPIPGRLALRRPMCRPSTASPG
jgi:NAD(P)-dependent dehydrogenase (short-subunit alcohol dehydrogenase family)